jgi:GNAT superfamily N-acetyltransferase
LGRPSAILFGDDLNGFVFAPEHGIAVGFGKPPMELAEELRDVADEHGMAQEGLELHLPAGGEEAWLARPDARPLGTHRIQTLAEAAANQDRWATLQRYESVYLKSQNDPRLQTLPRALRGEFAAMKPWPIVVASLAGDCIASIASAFVETEGYFDVSIDTVADFRRSGFGSSCAAALIQHQAQRGKEPVWMVRANNRASLALSSSLGFVDVGLVVGVELRR